jgi:hypothetical protein
MRAAVQSHVLEHAVVHSEQDPPFAPHLEGELDRADQTPDPLSSTREAAAEA